MDSKTIKYISTQVYRKFPEMNGVQPKTRLQQSSSGSGRSSKAGPSTFLLTYQTKVEIGEGWSMPRWVRVIANAQGTILKITTSH